jgi:GNAT superfamily N-acetyltransferase
MRAFLDALEAGQPVGTPDVLFAKITDEQVEEWKRRFGGAVMTALGPPADMPDDADIVRAVRLEGLKRHPDAFSRDYEQDAQRGLDEWRATPGVGRVVRRLCRQCADPASPRSRAAIPARRRTREASAACMCARAHAGQRLGRAPSSRPLLDHATEEVEQVALTVNADNARAIKFYERQGFRTVGRIPRAHYWWTAAITTN